MLSETQQKRVWEGMLSSEIRSNYFAELSSQYRARPKWANFLTLLASSGAFATFILNNPDPWIVAARPILAFSAAALSAYPFVADNQKLAGDAVTLHRQWNHQAKKYEALWENMYTEDAIDLLTRLSMDDSQLSELGTNFPEKKHALLRWQEFVERHHQAPA